MKRLSVAQDPQARSKPYKPVPKELEGADAFGRVGNDEPGNDEEDLDAKAEPDGWRLSAG